MKTLWYFLTVVAGLIGVLAAVRIIERLMSGASLLPAQLLIALISLVAALLFLRKARAI